MNARAPLMMLLLLAGCATVATAPEPTESELAMQTDAVVNLPRYVEWPEGAFILPKTPIMIGIYGHSKIHKAVTDATQGKSLNGRVVMVRRYHWPQVPNCHMLFIAPSERYRLPWIMKQIEHSNVLTVSAFDDFLARGGMVRLSFKDEKIRFHVNTTVVKDAGLKFSSKFLAVADQIVAAE
jgi:hypothetical protein